MKDGFHRNSLLNVSDGTTNQPQNVGKKLYTKKGANGKLRRLLNNIPRLVRHDAITFLDANLEIVLEDGQYYVNRP